MPSAGFLQKIKTKEIQKLTDVNYTKQLSISKSLKAGVDLWLKYNCQYKGNYYITAIYAKEDIKYVNFWYPKDFNLRDIKRTCGKGNKIVLLMAKSKRDFAYTSDKAFEIELEGKEKRYKCSGSNRQHRYCYWKILCGNVKMQLGNSNITVANDFESFMAIGVSKGALGYSYDDLTLDFWLELTKTF